MDKLAREFEQQKAQYAVERRPYEEVRQLREKLATITQLLATSSKVTALSGDPVAAAFATISRVLKNQNAMMQTFSQRQSRVSNSALLSIADPRIVCEFHGTETSEMARAWPSELKHTKITCQWDDTTVYSIARADERGHDKMVFGRKADVGDLTTFVAAFRETFMSE